MDISILNYLEKWKIYNFEIKIISFIIESIWYTIIYIVNIDFKMDPLVSK